MPKQRSSLRHTTHVENQGIGNPCVCSLRFGTGVARQSTTFTSLGQNPGTGIIQLIERPTKKPGGDIDAGSSPWCGKGLFSRSLLSVQTLLRCPYSPRVQSHASASVRALKIPNTCSHKIPLFGRTKILHVLTEMGSAALAAAAPCMGKAPPKFPARNNEVIKKRKRKKKSVQRLLRLTLWEWDLSVSSPVSPYTYQSGGDEKLSAVRTTVRSLD